MKSKIAAFLFLLPALATAGPHYCRTIKIAIIDSGLDITDRRFEGHLCSTGSKSFVVNPKLTDAQNLLDRNGHGTAIASIIQTYAGDSNYCFMVYKYFSSSLSGIVNLANEIKAIRQATEDGADIVNISGGGPQFSEDESLAIKDNPDVVFVVAAGNEGKNTDLPGNEFYPASYGYANEYVVGALGVDGKRLSSSNYGKKVDNYELGEKVHVYIPYDQSTTMSGTSMSTAIKTGKLINEISKKKCK